MDSFELNKLLGALLGTVFIVFSISIVSDAIFASPVPEKPGYAIEAAEAEAGVETAGGGDQEEPIAARLASADVGKGEAIHKKCVACHTVEKGGANKTGPNLWDVVNRPIASHEGFAYSAAMKEFSQGGSVVWDFEHLDKFLAAPKGYIKGTAMGFAGVKPPKDRADLIAYLRTLSDNPAPLPTADAAAPAAEGAAATGEAPAAEGAQPATPAEAAPAEGAQPPAAAAPADGAAQPAAPAPAEGATQPAPADGSAQPAPAQ